MGQVRLEMGAYLKGPHVGTCNSLGNEGKGVEIKR